MRSNKEENWKKWFKEKGKKLEIEEKMDYGYFFELLDIADDDLIASNILYRKKFYAHSIYLLQQAIEKLGKSILLHEGFCNKSDLKNKVGHDVSVYLLKEVEKLSKSLIESNILSAEPYGSLMAWIRAFLTNYKQERKSPITTHISFNEIKQGLNHLNKYKKIFRIFGKVRRIIRRGLKSRDVQNNLIKSQIEREEEYLGRKLSENEKNKLFLENAEISIEKFPFIAFELTLCSLYSMISFAFLSINLEIHSNVSRYPDLISYYRYNKDLDIVKLYPLMRKVARKSYNSYIRSLTLLSKLDESAVVYLQTD